MKLLSPMLYLILLLIALELINIHMVLGKNASEYQQYLRSVCNSSEPVISESVCTLPNTGST